MYADQKMDALKVETLKVVEEAAPVNRRLVGKRSIGASDANKIFLVSYFKKTNPPFFQDPEQRRAWARSSLGHHHRLGKSYSMLSIEQPNVSMISKKRGNTFKANVMEAAAAPHDKNFDEEEESSMIVGVSLISLKTSHF
jgi:hypothetical protein